MRLDENWKTQKREEGSEIGKRKQVIRRFPRSATSVPCLRQRARRAEHHERQSNRKREQSQDAPGGVDRHVRTPENLRRNRQPDKADRQKTDVQRGLARWRKSPSNSVRI